MLDRKRFMVGKYEIIAQPIPNSAHMLRYTVFVDGNRIGAFPRHAPAGPAQEEPRKLSAIPY
jgi:hypothetical protein